VITIFAPAGIGEVVEGDDLGRLVADAVAADPEGPLSPGDIVVVTSKIVSKAEGRRAPAGEREQAISQESVATVAWRGPMRIVRTRLGLVQAAAGVDNSNVSPADILLLPEDPDASAAVLCKQLSSAAGGAVGVIVSDTAGRAWRIGQTDHAIGASGVLVGRSYAGLTDSYGNPLQVTLMALADELAAAADLVKGKLGQHPVAVVRGLTDLVVDQGPAATELVRPAGEDMFARGSREAVVAAVLAAVGRPDAYEQVVGLEGEDLLAAVFEHCSPDDRDLVARILRARA
jgi:coenzyme F420-0:L-glutamate ligase / coenzyme F420-1:gamma-L-glutamate ligase